MSRQKQYASYQSLAPKEEKKADTYACMEMQNLEHRKQVLMDNYIVCIDLYADWCQPCKHIAPQFAELAKRYNNPGVCILVKENVDMELTRDFQITGIPAFIFYRGGQLVRHPDGSPVHVMGGDLKKIEEILDNLIGQGN